MQCKHPELSSLRRIAKGRAAASCAGPRARPISWRCIGAIALASFSPGSMRRLASRRCRHEIVWDAIKGIFRYALASGKSYHVLVIGQNSDVVQQVPATLSPRRAFCIGGHGTEPKEQNTQQSPSFGRSSAPHRLQS